MLLLMTEAGNETNELFYTIRLVASPRIAAAHHLTSSQACCDPVENSGRMRIWQWDHPRSRGDHGVSSEKSDAQCISALAVGF